MASRKQIPGSFIHSSFKVVTRTLLDFVVGDFQNTLYALLAAVFLLLLIACGNVGNLLLAGQPSAKGRLLSAPLWGQQWTIDSPASCREFCARCGGLRRRLFVRLCWIKRFGGHHFRPVQFPRKTVIGLNPAVLVFALAIAVLTTLICGLAPALHTVRGNVQLRMTNSGKGGGRRLSPWKTPLRSGDAEVALSIMLLTGAGLMMRSFFTLTHVDLGFNPERMLYARVAPAADGRYDTAVKKKLFFGQVLQRVKALPGVITATVS